MGIKYKFTCGYCNYHVVTSGGADSGIKILSDTIRCKDCNSISDVKISEDIKAERSILRLEKKANNDEAIIHYKEIDLPIICPVCESINTELWNGNCPKCNKLMVCGDAVIFWD